MNETSRQVRAADAHVVASAVKEIYGHRAELIVAERMRRCKSRGDHRMASQWQRVRFALQEGRGPRFS